MLKKTAGLLTKGLFRQVERVKISPTNAITKAPQTETESVAPPLKAPHSTTQTKKLPDGFRHLNKGELDRIEEQLSDLAKRGGW